MRYILVILVFLFTTTLSAEQIVINNDSNSQAVISVVQSSDDCTVLSFDIHRFTKKLAFQNNQQCYYNLYLDHFANMLDKGYPQLPKLSSNIIIPNNAKVRARITNSKFIDYPMLVAPSKGLLSRNIDPKTIPYEWSAIYENNAFYPTQNVELSEPFILRDFRGITVTTYPFAYNPVTHTLRVYSLMEVQIERIGIDSRNNLTRNVSSFTNSFTSIYQNFFVNFPSHERYTQIGEQGKLLIICPPNFMHTMATYVNWKRQKGIPTEIVNLNTIGTTAQQIQTYIQNRYVQDNELSFVQLVGDAPVMPTLMIEHGGSDPSYALVSGNDSYPDILVGRFSATTTAELETQINRSIFYEKDLTPQDTWLNKALGIASDQGEGEGHFGESDITHIRNIAAKLDAYGYTQVDSLYDIYPVYSEMLADRVNNGIGFINYCGHGNAVHFATTKFGNNDVDALINDNKLPFIVAVACDIGSFTLNNTPCFAEKWLRSTNESTTNPTGAIGAFMSSIGQIWTPPMTGQDEIVDLLTSEQLSSMGALCFNGSCKMIEMYGSVGIDMAKAWNVFGDCSLQLRSKAPQPLVVNSCPYILTGQNSYSVATHHPGALVCLSDSSSHSIIANCIANEEGIATLLFTPASEPTNFTLTVTAFNAVTACSQIEVIVNSAPHVAVDTFCPASTPLYNSEIAMNAGFTNYGNQLSQTVIAYLSSSDEYIDLIDSTETLGSFTINQTISFNNCFRFHVSKNVPDDHLANFLVTLHSGDTFWTYSKSLYLQAPNITCGLPIVSDENGNNNGIAEAGESITVTIPIQNIGHANSPIVTSLLVPSNDLASVEESVKPVGCIDSLSSHSVTYTVHISNELTGNTSIMLVNRIDCDQYDCISNVFVPLCFITDNFENNTLNLPWRGDWSVCTNSPFEGNACYKSLPISQSSTSSASLVINVATEGNVSFYRKVSSEHSYDFLNFYIDNVVVGAWSGFIEWDKVSYPLSYGNHTLKWEYAKDVIGTEGEDCAWIDNLTLPVLGDYAQRPVLVVLNDTINFGSVFVGHSAIKELLLSNGGTIQLTGSIMVPNGYSIHWEDESTRSTQSRVAYSIPASTIRKMIITFTPTLETSYIDTLLISSDDTFNSSVAIPMIAVALPDANSDQIAMATILKDNYPNPFNPSTTILFDNKSPTKVTLEIFNIKGQKVKTLINNIIDKGTYHITWKGDNDRNLQVSSGIYFYRLRTNSYCKTKKMLLLK